MNVFEAVRNNVTARQAAEFYGIRVQRNGMACCPFHPDRTPSMKLDSRYHCFGCGADGDAISFVSEYLGLGVKEAAERLAQDFGISYSKARAPARKIYQEKQERRKITSLETRFEHAKNRFYGLYCDYLRLLEDWKERCAPAGPEGMDIADERFTEALQNISRIEYILDSFIDADAMEKISIMNDHREEVRRLEARIKGTDTGAAGPVGADAGRAG